MPPSFGAGPSSREPFAKRDHRLKSLAVAYRAGPGPLSAQRRLAPTVRRLPVAPAHSQLRSRTRRLGNRLRTELQWHPRTDRKQIKLRRDGSRIRFALASFRSYRGAHERKHPRTWQTRPNIQDKIKLAWPAVAGECF